MKIEITETQAELLREALASLRAKIRSAKESAGPAYSRALDNKLRECHELEVDIDHSR
jgi:hypothetical protein